MKDAEIISVTQAIERLSEFDLILDARSPGEFADDHLPGAVNAPVLDDAQRAQVGTLYKQVGAFEAKRLGAALVSRNIAHTLETLLAQTAREARLLIYCWRGGNRSGSLATVLARVGWRTSLIEGGYREFRRHVVSELETLPGKLHYLVVAGRTGSGKSLILERLALLGAQVLDLEKIARHRGSVLGHLPDARQPSQKHFESQVWQQLRAFDPSKPILIESESRKIGQCQVPGGLIMAMRASPCVRIDASDEARSALLLSEYQHFVNDPDRLRQRLEALISHHGQTRVESWMQKVGDGAWEEFVLELLHEHYDPAYDRSMNRNFPLLAQSPIVELEAASGEALDRAAQGVLSITRS
jgi:tRNA 2-selenouridine synthase